MSYDSKMEEVVKIKNGGHSEKYYLVNEKDEVFFRQILANKIWNTICEDSGNPELRIDSELRILQDSEGIEKLYVYCPNTVGKDCNNIPDIVKNSVNSVDYYTFLQFTYAYKNVYENVRQITNIDESMNLLPGRVEYSFGILPNALEYKTYLYEGRVIPERELFGNDATSYYEVFCRQWLDLRNTSLSDEKISKLIDRYAKLVAKSGFPAKSGLYKDDSEFKANDYYLDYVNQFKKEQLKRLDNLDKLCQKELSITGDGFLSGYEPEMDEIYSITPQNDLDDIRINTATGSMKFVDQKRGNCEPGIISYTDDEGNQHTSNLSWIKGKGHSSFARSAKKNYLIQFDGDKNILGIGNSEQYVLVANSLDPSRIRNAVAYTLCKEFGMEGTTDFRFVNLYLNDSYHGIYMVVIPPKAVDASYLFEINDDVKRFSYGHYYFKDNNGVRYEIDLPKDISGKELINISKQIDEINELIEASKNDNAIYDELCKKIDIDSFEKMYFSQMILDDVDANYASTYFYFDSESILYAGPVWDYDLSLGNYGKVHNVYGDSSFRAGMSQKLFLNEVFYQKLCADWKAIYRDKCIALAEKSISEIYEEINPAMQSEVNRWRGMDGILATGSERESEADKIRNFIYERISLLDNKLGYDGN